MLINALSSTIDFAVLLPAPSSLLSPPTCMPHRAAGGQAGLASQSCSRRQVAQGAARGCRVEGGWGAHGPGLGPWPGPCKVMEGICFLLLHLPCSLLPLSLLLPDHGLMDSDLPITPLLLFLPLLLRILVV